MLIVMSGFDLCGQPGRNQKVQHLLVSTKSPSNSSENQMPGTMTAASVSQDALSTFHQIGSSPLKINHDQASPSTNSGSNPQTNMAADSDQHLASNPKSNPNPDPDPDPNSDSELKPEAPTDLDEETETILAELEQEINLISSSSPADPPPNPLHHQPHLSHRIQAPTTLQTLISEESLLKTTADAPASVVLFYSPSFPTSLSMKGLFSTLASQYHLHHTSSRSDQGRADAVYDDDDDDEGRTIFLAAEAEKCEWLCRRVNVRVLPVIIGYVHGTEVGRVVGFEGVSGGEAAAGWRALGWVVGRWGSAAAGFADGCGSDVGGAGWIGTMQAKGQQRMGSLLGRDWEGWVRLGEGRKEWRNDGRNDDEDDDEDELERRRRQGYIGGGGGGARTNGRLKIGGRQRHALTADEDDDWD